MTVCGAGGMDSMPAWTLDQIAGLVFGVRQRHVCLTHARCATGRHPCACMQAATGDGSYGCVPPPMLCSRYMGLALHAPLCDPSLGPLCDPRYPPSRSLKATTAPSLVMSTPCRVSLGTDSSAPSMPHLAMHTRTCSNMRTRACGCALCAAHPSTQAVLVAFLLSAKQIDVFVARAQRRQLGLCEQCGGVFEPGTCQQQNCPLKAAAGSKPGQ